MTAARRSMMIALPVVVLLLVYVSWLLFRAERGRRGSQPLRRLSSASTRSNTRP